MLQVQGKGTSYGIVAGPLYFYTHVDSRIDRSRVENPQQEWKRYCAARDAAVADLALLEERARQEAGEKAAEVFGSHAMIAQDEDFNDAIFESIRGEGLNASAAVCDASAQFQNMFRNMNDPYMQARAADVRDVAQRLNDILLGRSRIGIESEGPVILVADDLTPSEVILLDRSRVLGFVTRGGSITSHAAILARSRAIPAVMNVGEALWPAMQGREAILDGESGLVVVNPTGKMRLELFNKREKLEARWEMLQRLKGSEDVTADGVRPELLCNISSPDDMMAVAANDGRGIGLFRSEYLYLMNEDYPSEEQQFRAYREVMLRMQGAPVIIRTLDLGSDKQAPYLGLEPEPNPLLGLRSIRLSFARPGMFRTQLRALYRASAFGRLTILFPLISSIWELREAVRMCEVVKAELTSEGIEFDHAVPMGIMVETPAAVLIADRLAREADFFSIGTNDLLQYILACDPQVSGNGRYYNSRHPALLRAVKMVCEAAHRHGIRVGVCGEAAADLELVPTFLALGVDQLSVAPSDVLPVRDMIQKTDVNSVRPGIKALLESDEFQTATPPHERGGRNF